MVREACVKGLLHSLSCNLNGDLLALLSKLHVESSSEDGLKVDIAIKLKCGLSSDFRIISYIKT